MVIVGDLQMDFNRASKPPKLWLGGKCSSGSIEVSVKNPEELESQAAELVRWAKSWRTEPVATTEKENPS